MTAFATQSFAQSTMDDTSHEISLTGLFNLNKLETMLTQMYNKLQQQTKVIQELQQRPTLQQYNTLQSTVQQLQNSVDILTQRLNAVESVSDIVNEHASHIEQIESTLEHTPTTDDLTTLNSTLLATIDSTFAQLNKDKVSKTTVNALEHSNKEVVSELRSVQQLLAHKIDHSELPLLESTNEKLSELLQFEHNTIEQLNTLKSEHSIMNKLIQGKESKEAIVARMQAIHTHLQRKADVTQLESINNNLQQLNETTGLINQLTQQHSTLKEQLAGISSTGSLHDVLDSVMKQLNSKLDLKQIDSVKQELQKTEQKTLHDLKVQSAYVAELKQQITELQEANVNVEQKLSVALKFVDWFTESRLGR